MSDSGWPHGVVSDDCDLPMILSAALRPFDWAVRTSVRCLSDKSEHALEHHFMRRWGHVRTGPLVGCDIWVRNLEPEVTMATFRTTLAMAIGKPVGRPTQHKGGQGVDGKRHT